MWGASNHLHAVGHRHAGHLQGGLQVGGAIVYPRDYVAVKIKQRYHFANWSSTSPTAINSHLRRIFVRCLACHGSDLSHRLSPGLCGSEDQTTIPLRELELDVTHCNKFAPQANICSLSCLSWLHLLNSWSLRQTRG